MSRTSKWHLLLWSIFNRSFKNSQILQNFEASPIFLSYASIIIFDVKIINQLVLGVENKVLFNIWSTHCTFCTSSTFGTQLKGLYVDTAFVRYFTASRATTGEHQNNETWKWENFDAAAVLQIRIWI